MNPFTPVPAELLPKIDAVIVASSNPPSEKAPNIPLHRIRIKSKISKQELFFEFREFTETMNLRIPRTFHSKRMSVRVYKGFVFRGKVLWISYSPSFTLNISASMLTFSGSEATSALNLRFSEAVKRAGKPRVRKLVQRMPVGKPLRPNPEHVDGYVPYFVSGGGIFENRGFDTVPVYHREYSSVRTPDFSRKKRLGQLPVNSHGVKIERRYDFGDLIVKNVLDVPELSQLWFRSYWFTRGSPGYGPVPTIGHLTVQDNRALERLRTRATGETANLSETFATMNKTFDMMTGTFRRIAGSVQALKKLQIQRAVDTLFQSQNKRFRKGGGPSASRSLAENWLELQYGWKPLLNDIHYSVTALGKLVTPDTSIGRITASASHEVKEAALERPNSVGHPPVVGSWTKTTRTTTRYGMRYRVSDPFRAVASQSGFTNPVSLAWELIPFSFVVDWLIPIGPYLESLDAWGGLTLLDGYKTKFTRVAMDFNRYYSGSTFPDGDVHPTLYWEFRGKLLYDAILLDRTALNGFPSPDPPSFKNPFSTGHALNALALVRTVFGKR